MVNEEVKLDLNVQAVRAGQSAQKAEPQKSNAVTSVFEGFKKYAKKLGFELSTEKVQEFINANPDILSKTPEELNKAFKNFISSQSSAAQVPNPTPEAESGAKNAAASSETETSQPANPFEVASDTDIEALLKNLEKAENAAEENSEPAAKNLFAAKAETQPESAKQAETKPAAEESVKTEDKQDKAPAVAAKDGKQKNETIAEYFDRQTDFDTKTYSEKLTKPEMEQVYIRQYAKNNFLFGNPDEPKSDADWVKLPEDEKQKYIEQAKQQVYADKSFSAAMDDEFIAKIMLNTRMIDLQTASANGTTLSEFNKLDKNERNSAKYEMLDLKRKTNDKFAESNDAKDYDYSQFSVAEKLFMDKEDTSLSALQYYAKKQGMDGADGLCHENVAEYVKNNKVNMAVATKEYLANKSESGDLTDLEKLEFAALNKLEPSLIEAYGSEAGKSSIDEEIAEDSKYADKFNNATPALRQVYKLQYITEKYKNEPAKIKEIMLDEIKHSNIETAIAIHALVGNDENLSKELAESRDKNIAVLNNSGLGHLQPEHMQTAVKLGASLLGEENLTNLFNHYGINTVQDKDLDTAAGAIGSNVKDQKLLDTSMTLVFDRGNHCENVDDGINAINSAKEHASQQCQQEAALGTVGSPHEAEYGAAYVKDNGETAAYMVDNGIPSKYRKENQTAMFSSLKNSIEKNLPKNEAVSSLNKLSDQIVQCDASNQLAMHKEISTSKYSAVVEHAAQNIHKYDVSVQADAMRLTFATGDERAIEIVISNLDLISASAVAALRNEINTQIEAMESRHFEDLLSDYTKKKLGRELEGISQKSPEYSDKVKAYIAELKKLPQTELYQRICTDFRTWPTSLQTSILDKIAKYSPKLLTMFIDRYGIKLLTGFGQVNIATKNAILMEMLKTPSKRADAMEYIKSNSGGNFSDSVKDFYNKIVAEREGDDYDNVKANKQKNTDDEQSYQASAVFGSQSGSTRTNLNRDEGDYWKTKANLNAYLA